MDIKTLAVGQLKTNCYLVFGFKSSSREAIIIDPGGDSDYIIQKIRDYDLKPKLIVATHGHFDHILAVNELKAAFKIPFAMNKKDQKLLSWMRHSANYFTNFDPGPPPRIDKNLKEGEEIQISNFKFQIIETPGHTPGGVCLYSQKEKLVFAGDSIFAGGGIGRTDFPYCNKEDLTKSIKKLTQLPKETLVYSGHGDTTTIGEFSEAQKQQSQF